MYSDVLSADCGGATFQNGSFRITVHIPKRGNVIKFITIYGILCLP
jgi:hypothetical protein